MAIALEIENLAVRQEYMRKGAAAMVAEGLQAAASRAEHTARQVAVTAGTAAAERAVREILGAGAQIVFGHDAVARSYEPHN